MRAYGEGSSPRRFRKGEKVAASTRLPGVPEGTDGRSCLVDGLTWIRYWVLFENGVAVGSVNGTTLARPKQYQQALDRRARAAEAAEVAGGGRRGDGRGRRRRGRRRVQDRQRRDRAAPPARPVEAARERLAA